MTSREPEADRTASDEVEILDVMGVDADAPPCAVEAPSVEAAGDDEVEILFDEPEDRTVAPDPPVVPDRERLLRLYAEFENLKKRTDRERAELEAYAASGLIARLLPVLDNLERALRHAQEPRGGEGLFEGLKLIQRQMLEELRRAGLRAVDTMGEPFDPRIHEAVSTVERSDIPTGTIVEELQRGYRLHERLLRPALVRVSSGGRLDAPVVDADAEA